MRVCLEAEKQQLLDENERREETLKKQTLSAGDVERINHARQELLRQVEATEKEVAALDSQMWEEDMHISKAHGKVRVWPGQVAGVVVMRISTKYRWGLQLPG